jgi:hypothetical protein
MLPIRQALGRVTAAEVLQSFRSRTEPRKASHPPVLTSNFLPIVFTVHHMIYQILGDRTTGRSMSEPMGHSTALQEDPVRYLPPEKLTSLA